MKDRTTERTVRKIIASLLDSDLTATELKRIGQQFIKNREFAENIGQACLSVTDVIWDRPKGKPSPMSDSNWVEMATTIVKQKRKPKRDLLDAISNFVPSMPHDYPNERMKVAELLQLVSEFATASELRSFTSWLKSGDSWGDAYLEGIMDKH